MKNHLIIIILLFVLCSCDTGWDSASGKFIKGSFMLTCAAGGEGLENYCDCVWNYIIQEYTIDDMAKMAEGSPEMNQYLNNIEKIYAPACFGMLESY